MRKQPSKEFGQADLIDEPLGLDFVFGPKVASIVVFADNIEHHLERAIWILEGIVNGGILWMLLPGIDWPSGQSDDVLGFGVL